MLAALTRTVRHIFEPAEPEMPPVAPQQNQIGPCWEPQAADSRLAKTVGASPSGAFTSDLSDEHKLPETTPKPTFTLGLDH